MSKGQFDRAPPRRAKTDRLVSPDLQSSVLSERLLLDPSERGEQSLILTRCFAPADQ